MRLSVAPSALPHPTPSNLQRKAGSDALVRLASPKSCAHRADNSALLALKMLCLCRCIMPKARPITPRELDEIKKSAHRAFCELVVDEILREEGLPDVSETQEQSESRQLLRSLKSEKRPNLSERPWPKTLEKAARRNDLTFFKTLGKILRSPPSTNGSQRGLTKRQSSALNHFLCRGWARSVDGHPPLFSLRQDDLLNLCEEVIGVEPSTIYWDRLLKRRQRLGLKAFKRGKLKLQNSRRRKRLAPL